MADLHAAKVSAYMSKWSPAELARISVTESDRFVISFVHQGQVVMEMAANDSTLKGDGVGRVIGVERVLKDLSLHSIYPDCIDVGIYHKDFIEAIIAPASEPEKDLRFIFNATP